MFSNKKNYKICPVTAENWQLVSLLSVKKEQDNFIESNLYSLAQAYVETYWKPKALYADGVLVGFAMYGLVPQEGLWLDRFMIDRQHQGQGLGRIFLNLLINKLKKDYQQEVIYSSRFQDNSVMRRMLSRFGFKETGSKDERGEEIVVLELRGPVCVSSD